MNIPTRLHWRIALTLLALGLCGCSSFNRDWRSAETLPTSPHSIEGRWEGRWDSEANGHNGKLRCLMTRISDSEYRARFRATYARVLKFSYTAELRMQPHHEGWEFNGEADLGKLAGGVYYYEGRISSSNMFSTYRSKYDQGTFELQRPE
jgi:hypothetical protein